MSAHTDRMHSFLLWNCKDWIKVSGWMYLIVLVPLGLCAADQSIICVKPPSLSSLSNAEPKQTVTVGRFQVSPSKEVPVRTTPIPTACPITSAVDQSPPSLTRNPTPRNQPQRAARKLPSPLSLPPAQRTQAGSPPNQEHMTGSPLSHTLLTGYPQNQQSVTGPPQGECLLLGSSIEQAAFPPLDTGHIRLETKDDDDDEEDDADEEEGGGVERDEEEEEVEDEEEEAQEQRRRRKRGRRPELSLSLLGTSVDSGFSVNNVPDSEGRMWEEQGGGRGGARNPLYATPLHHLWMSNMRSSSYLSSNESESEVEEVWEELQEMREK